MSDQANTKTAAHRRDQQAGQLLKEHLGETEGYRPPPGPKPPLPRVGSAVVKVPGKG